MHTARLDLRPLTADDVGVLFAYRSDPAVARYQGMRPQSIEEAAAFIALVDAVPFAAPGRWSQLAVVQRDERRMIGDVGMHVGEAGRTAEVGFTIAPAAQRRGYALEAVSAVIAALHDAHAVTSFVAHVHPENAASLGLLARLGFRSAGEDRGDLRLLLRV